LLLLLEMLLLVVVVVVLARLLLVVVRLVLLVLLVLLLLMLVLLAVPVMALAVPVMVLALEVPRNSSQSNQFVRQQQSQRQLQLTSLIRAEAAWTFRKHLTPWCGARVWIVVSPTVPWILPPALDSSYIDAVTI
jgi:hypothetical protein